MAHGQPAPRPERQVVAHPPVLGEQRRRAVDGGGRPQGRVADGLAADLRGGEQVAFEQPRRDGEDVADVVEAVPRLVGRQQGLAVDLEGQQVADGVDVLGPVQPLQRGPARIGCGLGRAVEGRLEIRDERGVALGVGARPRRRRHRAGPELPQHLLPDRGVVPDVRGVDVLEREAGGQGAGVVAGDAVAVQHGAGGGCLGRHAGRRRGRHAGRRRGRHAGRRRGRHVALPMRGADTHDLGRSVGRRLCRYGGAGRRHGDGGEARDADDPCRAACHPCLSGVTAAAWPAATATPATRRCPMIRLAPSTQRPLVTAAAGPAPRQQR